MSNDLRTNIDLVAKTFMGDGMANKNDGLFGTSDTGFEPNPDANPADVVKAWREVAKRLTPGSWASICAATGIPADVLLPRAADGEPTQGSPAST